MSTLVWNTSFIVVLIPVLIQSHLVYQIIAAFQAAYVGHRLLVECQEKNSWNVNCLRFHEMSSKNISWQNTAQVSRQMEDNKNILVGIVSELAWGIHPSTNVRFPAICCEGHSLW